jgi:hypothetical protein
LAIISITIPDYPKIKMTAEAAILGRGEFCKVVGEGLLPGFLPGSYIIAWKNIIYTFF